jgi:anaerobic selenocysteine-containing dehydrogenase
MNVRCVTCLPAVVGAWRRRGGGLLGSTGSGQAFDTSVVTREDLQPGPTRLVNMNRLGHALNELADPRVMALFVYNANPAAVTPDQAQVLRGLAREDLFTVVHERFLTDTARWADLVLPATSSLEHHDMYVGYGQYCLQRVEPAIPPVGESRPNWELFRELARRMGIDHPFFRQEAPQVLDALLARPAPLRQGIDLAGLAEGRAVELALPPSARAFRTPSGRIEIENPRLAHPLPGWLPTHEEEGRLPFRLMTGAALHGLNSSFRERPELVRREGGVKLLVHPDDARRRGLAGAAQVVAWNDLGSSTFDLEVTDRAPPGVVVAEGVPWLTQVVGGRNVNTLTSQRLTDEGAGSTFYDNRVDLRPAP